MRGIAVGGIDPDRKRPLPGVSGQVRPGKPEQRPYQHAGHLLHSGQSAGAGALEGAHEHRLGLVVGMVRGEDQDGTESFAEAVEPGVPRLARRGLPRARSESEPGDLTPEAEALGERGHVPRDGRAIGMDTVVGVRHHEMEALGGGAMKEIEKSHGVETAGDGDQRPAGRQGERCEMRAELVVEIHRRKANPSSRAQADHDRLPFRCTAGEIQMVSQTILVVDDDLPACEITCRILRDAGFECVWANTGEHALSLLVERKEAPDLFVFDVRLPDMPGPTLAWLLSDRYGTVPVLFISGYPSFDAALLSAGRWHFLAKPFSPETLVSAVRRMLTQPDIRARSAS